MSAPITLVCLPYAGGVAGAYRRWQRTLAPGIAVVPLDYPGRGTRASEPMLTDGARIVADVAERVAELGAAKCVLFGHSMGGWAAYEATRRLEVQGKAPAGLIISATSSPQHIARRVPNGALSDRQLRDKCLAWGGTPEELLDDPRFYEPLFAHLRADMAAIDSYTPDLHGSVAAPMIALAGTADATAPSGEVAGWAAHARDWRGLRVVTGGHFFTTTAEALVLRIVLQHCRAVARPASRAVPASGSGSSPNAASEPKPGLKG